MRTFLLVENAHTLHRAAAGVPCHTYPVVLAALSGKSPLNRVGYRSA